MKRRCGADETELMLFPFIHCRTYVTSGREADVGLVIVNAT